jgi:hypothetical protein
MDLRELALMAFLEKFLRFREFPRATTELRLSRIASF